MNHGQSNGKGGPLPYFAREAYASLIVLNDPPTDKETQTGTHALFFCGKEWIEYLFEIFLRDSTSRISKIDHDKTLPPALYKSAGDLYLPPLGHSMHGIYYEIKEHLFQLVGINKYLGKVWFILFYDLNLEIVESIGDERKHLINESKHIDKAFFALIAP